MRSHLAPNAQRLTPNIFQRRARLRVARDIDRQPQLRIGRRAGLQMLEAKRPELGVLDRLRPRLLADDLVARPPGAELRARLGKLLDERREGRVVGAAGVLGAEAPEVVLGGPLPPRPRTVPRRVGEQPPQEVAPLDRLRAPVVEQPHRGGVPGEHVERGPNAYAGCGSMACTNARSSADAS